LSREACRLAVVKLGGGVITVKGLPETVDYKSLEEAALHLAEYRGNGGLLVVVHGGGSFGHATVARILREKGRLSPLDSSIVQESMLKLALIVTRVLQDKGLKPSLHPPHSICINDDTSTCNLKVIERDLEGGLTPVTYGDAIPVGGETRIVSGDDLAAEIAARLKADCLVYVIREPGVIGVSGEPLQTLRDVGEVRVVDTKWDDVTGGIIKKVETALKASKTVKNVIITNIENLPKALKGEPVGTRIKARNT